MDTSDMKKTANFKLFLLILHLFVCGTNYAEDGINIGVNIGFDIKRGQVALPVITTVPDIDAASIEYLLSKYLYFSEFDLICSFLKDAARITERKIWYIHAPTAMDMYLLSKSRFITLITRREYISGDDRFESAYTWDILDSVALYKRESSWSEQRMVIWLHSSKSYTRHQADKVTDSERGRCLFVLADSNLKMSDIQIAIEKQMDSMRLDLTFKAPRIDPFVSIKDLE